MSPTSLYLFAALNKENLAATEIELIEDLFKRPLPVLTDTHDKLLIEAMDAADAAAAAAAATRSSSPPPSKKAKVANETLVTAKLETMLTEHIENKTNEHNKNKMTNNSGVAAMAEWPGVAAMAEWYVQHPTSIIQPVAKMDLVVYNKETHWEESHLLPRYYEAYAYMEIGICTKEDDSSLLGMWWEKMDQLLNYLNAVCVNKYRGAKRAKGKLAGKPGVPFPKHPVILSVLVWSKSRDKSAIGTFLLKWCGTSNKFRMALLSAELCHGREATSAAFGKVIWLIDEVINLGTENLFEEDQLAKDVWRYLGPDCVKFGKTKV
jgi:hypothetical protein